MRRAITYLQSASRLHAATKEPITIESIQEIGGVVPDGVMDRLGEALGVSRGGREREEDRDGDVDMKEDKKPRVGAGFERVRQAVENVVREGYSATQILSQVRILSLFLSPTAFWATERCLFP